MIRNLIAVLLLSSFRAIIASPEDGKDWAVDGAPYRVVLHAETAPDIPEAGWEIRLVDFGAGRPDMQDAVLLGPDGKEIALDGIWRGAGRNILMLAESMPSDGAAATLYFGSDSSLRKKSWSAKRSLLMETRRLPAGATITTYEGWRIAWQKSQSTDGASFVRQIFHGDNPHGENRHFLSRYTGILKTGNGGEIKFYTLSDDVSYVIIDGQSNLKWQKDQPPPLDPKAVPLTTIRSPKDFANVEYSHAVVEPPGAMVLGWEQGGKLGTVSEDAWIHPGKIKAERIESSDGAPVPIATIKVEQYIGYGNQWYVSVRGNVARVDDGWQVEWLWQDGRVDKGKESHRIWMCLDPVRVIVRLRNGERVTEGRRIKLIPKDLEAASVNNESQVSSFLELLGKEEPMALNEAARKSGFILARDFLPSTEASKWAEAWLKTAKPEDEAWASAMTMVIREIAKKDPNAAIDRLNTLPENLRTVMGRDANLLELDLRVFGLNDPSAVGLVTKLSKSGDKNLARLAKIRLGDYQLLNGRVDEAARCFSDAVSSSREAERTGPVIDRSHSLAIEDLVNDKHLNEARAKFDEWEMLRPSAKIDADQLYWRARVMFLTGEWKRALQDLETSSKVRPGSPEEIDVLFWKGRALYELERKDDARRIWNQLIKDYPKHERAEAAKQWLEKQ
ncbi:MAG: tetratricopeptide repeat protein [Gloeobacteraceae cyanobacterium ES-bin-144]|nr:tetratricopeptide repeat protein [Verrucomicrobiales bacterium]